ncbi:hypothetical protein Cch01nite_40210 [Cellulomonas chitinilytica]|uniref:Uncharacterized protein n=1 Tax=Cellulomonas chitinilytica TaxID=398759 RepID=A0A919P708_9CELL|nr:hypothetical protein [Cellulomonas chitinilytica]GIG23297.1 hypothetical protein Cch01nite_40210 [Cellulomonas chitinilytica]
MSGGTAGPTTGRHGSRWAASWRPSVLSRRAAWLVAAGVVVAGAMLVVVRYATGAGLAESARSGTFLVLTVGSGLTVNQLATRRRRRRAEEVERRSAAARRSAAERASWAREDVTRLP